MTLQPRSASERSFALDLLPWIVAACALLLYLLTLSHWITVGNLSHFAKLSGWTWNPELTAPLYQLITYPLRWLPDRYIPFTLNLTAAIFGTVTLALLARSVALLPHDRTVAQRERIRGEYRLLNVPGAWMPPLLAVLVCGLQLSFWENATSAGTSPGRSPSGHMFDLMIFAYVVRSLLEYRLDDRESWLTRSAFVYGLSMTNDWAMIGYLPLFLLALIWVKGASFFNPQFLTRFVLLMAAGLLFYLIFPIAYTLSENSNVPFWFALKANIGAEFFALKQYWRTRNVIAVLALTSLLPVLFMGIRWSSYFGDTSRMGATLAKTIFHVVHAFFLVACIWVAMDPPVSPRNQRAGVPFLTFYYLGALAVGYCAGYFLLVFGSKNPSRHARHSPSYVRAIDTTVTILVWALFLTVPIILFTLNFGRVRAANGPLLKDFATRLAAHLPKEQAIILSDDPVRLVLVRAALAEVKPTPPHVFALTTDLYASAAHAYLHRTFPQVWPQEYGAVRVGPVSQAEVLGLVRFLSTRHQVWYLHPSFGFFFEAFYPRPYGPVSRLESLPDLLPPAQAPSEIEENLQFWRQTETQVLTRLASTIQAAELGTGQGFLKGLLKRLHINPKPHGTVYWLANAYSRSLNTWGTQLQHQDRFEEAGKMFQRAFDLKPDNVVAQINNLYNQSYQRGQRSPLALSKDIEESFGQYRTWDQILAANGPYEEPAFCYAQGLQFQAGQNFAQAAQQYARARALYPGHITAGLALANVYNLARLPDKALAVLHDIRSLPELATQETNIASLVYVEVGAHLLTTNLDAAEKAVDQSLLAASDDANVLKSAVDACFGVGAFKQAVKWIDATLALAPNDVSALMSKSYASIHLGEFTGAIEASTRVLSMATNNAEVINSARFNRAIAHLQTGSLDQAFEDYEAVAKSLTNRFEVYYGLGEIAYRKRDTNAAIQNYERYLSLVQTNGQEASAVLERVREMKGVSP